MDINGNIFQNFLLTNRAGSIRPNPAAQNSVPSINSQPVKDEFVRTSDAQKITQVAKTPEEAYIERLYNETYDEVMGLMPPIVKDLNITKPTLVFEKDTDPNSSTLAAYNFRNNTLDVSEHLMKENIYLYYEKEGTLPTICYGEEGLRKTIMSQDAHYEGRVVKLNEEEKELALKSHFAHELRHCVQEHLLASCENVGDETKRIYDKNNAKIINLHDELISIDESMLQDGIETDENGKSIAENLARLKKEKEESINAYYKSYKPKKMLDENTMLKFSIFPDDNRYLSVKEHFLTNLKNKIGGTEDSKTEYYSEPMEIDAYNFTSEFIIYSGSSKPGIREDVLNGLALSPRIQAKIGFEHLEESGYPPLIE